MTTPAAPAPHTLDPAAVVDEFLRLVMIPDPQSASRFTAPDIRIRFTGNRPMHAPSPSPKAKCSTLKPRYSASLAPLGHT